jgi:hypothetical protein
MFINKPVVCKKNQWDVCSMFVCVCFFFSLYLIDFPFAQKNQYDGKHTWRSAAESIPGIPNCLKITAI